MNKYALSMGQGEDDIALEGLLGHRYNNVNESQELKSTSKFQGGVQDSFDKEFGSGDPEFDEAER